MNRLKGHRFYLSGPIDDCADLGKPWRDFITKVLRRLYNANVYDPLNKPIKYSKFAEDEMRTFRADWKKNGDFYKLAKFVKNVRHIDLRMVDKSDAGIFYLNQNVKMCGTMEELFTMNRQHKPCLIVCPQGVTNINDWLFGTIDSRFMFNDFKDLFKYLDWVNACSEEVFNDEGRWLFFEED